MAAGGLGWRRGGTPQLGPGVIRATATPAPTTAAAGAAAATDSWGRWFPSSRLAAVAMATGGAAFTLRCALDGHGIGGEVVATDAWVNSGKGGAANAVAGVAALTDGEGSHGRGRRALGTSSGADRGGQGCG